MQQWLVTLVLTLFCLLVSPLAEAQQKAVPVFVAEVITKPFVDEIEALGTVRANETVKLTTNVTETITAIHFDDGQRVKKGDVLVEMTSMEEHAQLEEVHSEIREAERQYNRIATLTESGSASTSLLDQRKREYETAKARLNAIQSRLEDRLVTAPFDGVLGLRQVSTGALVSPGDVITTLDDDSQMKLDFSVPSTFLAIIKPGAKITVGTRAHGNRTFEGEVLAVDGQIEQTTRSIRVRAKVPNPNGELKPGLLMHVNLHKNPRDALIIPEEALIPRGSKQFVLVVDTTQNPPIVNKRQVTLGSRRAGEVEITEGLSKGELVVIHGTMTARSGQPVEIRATERQNESLENLLNQTEGHKEGTTK